jgi:hypothetical protein
MAKDDDKLKEGREAFQRAADAETDNRRTYLDDYRFARLEEQWPEDIRKQREIEGRPILTINKLNAFIRQVVNDARQNKPSIKVHPADSGADKETAEVINGLIRNIEYTSNADVAYDTATECAVTGGFGYLRVGLDFAYDDAFDMDLSIQRVSNPLSIYGDPNSTAADSSDWDTAFVVDRLTKEQFKTQYGKTKTIVDWDDTQAWTDSHNSWRQDDTVLVAERWIREQYEKKILMLDNGMVIDESRIQQDPDLQILLEQGIAQVVKERMAKCHRVKQIIMSGVEILEENDWLGKYIPIIPVYGDAFDIEGKNYYRSLIHSAIGSQQMFNFWRTASTELVALAPRVPYIGPKGAFDHDQDKWNTANTKSHSYIEYDSKNGSLPAPQRQPLDMGVAAGALQEALNASDDMKASIGLYDASLGARSNETSGKAIMARQREGDVSTFHFMDNMARAIRHTGRILIDLIPHVYTGERVIRVLGEDRSERAVKINTQEPVEQVDPKTGQPMVDDTGQAVMRMHDLSAGKYDLTVTTGPSFTTRREEAAFQMTEMIRAFPPAAQVIGPELAKNLDWPGADKIAEKLEAMSSQQIPPEVEKAIQEGQQQIQQLTQENQQLKMDQSVEMKKAESAAEVTRMKAEADIAVQREKAAAEIQLQREKAAADVHIQREKVTADVSTAREKMSGDMNLAKEKQHLEREKADDKPDSSVKAAISKLDERMDKLERVMSAPVELIRDPKTGKATGSRRVLN